MLALLSLCLILIFGRFAGTDGGGGTTGLRSAVFLEQPKETTVDELGTATFTCSVVNSTFSVIWLVNNSDAAYRVFQDRGVSIIHDSKDYTRSWLEVPGHACNNNTEVYCAALRHHSDPQLRWIESERAMLVVKESAASATPTGVITGATSSPPLSTTSPTHMGWEGKPRSLKRYIISGAIGMVVVLVVVLALVVAVIVRRRKKGKTHEKKTHVEMLPKQGPIHKGLNIDSSADSGPSVVVPV